MLNGIISVSVGYTLVILKFGLVAKVLRECVVLAIGTESRSELRLAEEADFPMELSRHFAVGVHASKLGDLRVHLAGVLNHLLHGQLNLSDNVVGGVTVRIPKLDTQILVGLDELGSNKQTVFLSAQDSRQFSNPTYAAVSSQIGFKSSVITRVQYIGFPYLEKDKVM